MSDGHHLELDAEALALAVEAAVEAALYEHVWNYDVDDSEVSRQVENWSEVVSAAVSAYLAVATPDIDDHDEYVGDEGDSDLPCHCPMSHDEDIDRTMFWSGDCPAHGVESRWYNSTEQVERRRLDQRRGGARKLAVKARRNRHLVIACDSCGEELRVRRIGCLICDEDEPSVVALVEELTAD